jgi:DNA-binding IclR family transcriptional regulator
MAAGKVVHDDVLRRVQAEYLEMPGLRLTRAQAQRLWGLDPRTCDQLLSTLTETRFLARTRDGSFVLSSSRV